MKARYRKQLPHLHGDIFLTYTGMETDLLFTQCIDLPGFATYPLLETKEGLALLNQYLKDLINVAQEAGVGVILESHTWVANRDRGATLGYSPETLKDRNILSIEMLAAARDQLGDLPTVVSANIGPRSDAYAPTERMSVLEAEEYHREQIKVLATTEADLISGYTLAYPEEAIGMIRAARRCDMPIMIAFTVETDGCLPTGLAFGEAIEAVDKATEGYASYYMINCAHPDHFTQILSDAPWMHRLKGIVANASRCSHAELDNAEDLDDGNPEELGRQLSEINATHSNITILGGCCGTDMRHLSFIAAAAKRR